MASQKLQAKRAKAVTPSDTDNLVYAEGTDEREAVLYVGTGGDLKILTEGGDEVTLPNVQDGSFIPISIKRVYSTDTTADDIVALW